MRKKVLVILGVLLLIISISLFVTAKIISDKNELQYKKTYQAYTLLYKDVDKKIPVDDITLKSVEKVEKSVDLVVDKEKKKSLMTNLQELNKYIKLRDDINNYYENNIVKSSITIEMVNVLLERNNKLIKTHQELLLPRINTIKEQIDNINTYKTSIALLFTDNTYQTVRSDITRENLNQVLALKNNILQQDVINEQDNYLNIVDKELAYREEQERIRQEEERKRKEEEARKERERQIKEAWTVLNVSYISQNKNGVINGCEAACMLMALQYKGYLQNMDLVTYATNMPKSTNPFSGFIYDIFTEDPVSVPHWIAPSPLVAYGKTSSGYINIEDATGATLTDLDNQVAAGNPVIIYLTSKLNKPKAYIEGAPKNVHVLLLVGYNSITKEQILIDPWTHDDGRTSWHVSKSKIEQIYNNTSKRAVVIK